MFVGLLLFTLITAGYNSNIDEEKPQCEPCKSVIDKSMKYIEKYGIEMFKKMLITQYCEKLPSSLQSICVKAVETEAQKILNWMESQLTPEQICQAFVCCY